MTGDNDAPAGHDSIAKLTADNMALKVIVSSILVFLTKLEDDGGGALYAELSSIIAILTSEEGMPFNDDAGRAQIRKMALAYISGMADLATKN